MLIYTTAAYRAGIRTVHRLDNRYRYNDARACWEFDDGIGPWAPSANLGGLSHDEGVRVLARMSYSAEGAA